MYIYIGSLLSVKTVNSPEETDKEVELQENKMRTNNATKKKAELPKMKQEKRENKKPNVKEKEGAKMKNEEKTRKKKSREEKIKKLRMKTESRTDESSNSAPGRLYSF